MIDRRRMSAHAVPWFSGRRLSLAAALFCGIAAALAAAGCGGPKRVMTRPGDRDAGPVRDAGLPGAPLLLRVGLAAGVPVASLTLEGPTELLDENGGRVARFGAGAKVRFGVSGRKIAWRGGGRRGTVDSPARLRPLDPENSCVWREDPFPGEMLAIAGAAGVTLVNIVSLETYLRGVVPWEIGRPGAEGRAALAAQAVAARTYSVSHLGEREEFGFDLWADTRDQVYRGLRGTDPWCDRAIEETRGLVLRYRGREIEAYYCSTCGGVTSDIAEVWPRPARPYLVSHPDGNRPYCRDSAHFEWRTRWTRAELEKVLAESLPDFLDWTEASPARAEWTGRPFRPRGANDGRRPGALRDIAIEKRTTSGRVARLHIETDAGDYFIRGDRVRWVLAPPSGRFSILRSALFDLDVKRGDDGRPARITADGRGFGHGVGLCQTGALGMARRGRDFREILAHYYPGAQIESVRP